MVRKLNIALAAVAVAALPLAAHAAKKSDAIVIGMTLEPPGLDPTTGAAAAIGEIVHYNIFEGLMKIDGDGSVVPLLAEGKPEVAADAKTYTFHLKKGVKFSNGEALTAADVKFTFERDGAEKSTNKEKAVFANITAIDTPDDSTVVLHLKDPNPNLLFNLGENTGVILEPKSADADATKPVGTGPYTLGEWVKGSSIKLVKWDGFRDAAKIKIKTATFRIINDAAAQTAAVLSGDVDAFPRFNNFDSVKQLQADARLSVVIGSTEGKTIISTNNKKKPFDDVRVREAMAYAIDREAVNKAAVNGYGKLIGSHYTPTDPYYIDLTKMHPYDPAKAKALLKEAGVQLPLEVSLKLPPVPYARNSGEVVAAELGKVGINVKIENVEWAQWLDNVLKAPHNFDLTIISHVEPRDLNIYANPDYYFQYDSKEFQDIYKNLSTSTADADIKKWTEAAQKLLAKDAVNVYLFALPQVVVTKKGLKGFWKSSPVFANDLSAVHWD
ncbi:MAG TPA: ABC transporter substrate-binding protein [Magnetospirillaceae bacterium]